MDLDLISLNDWLSGFMNFERRPDKNLLNLATMKILCDYFGHPEEFYPCFHVAGSKGKGTISANIAGILDAAGYKVGIYSSPHAYHFTERVSSARGPFPKDIYYAAEKALRNGVSALISQGVVSKDSLTWFELVTVFAMLVFRAAEVDYAVFEVGMGGRLDTTNIVKPLCISMGPIELEHTEYLGDTLAKIAAEKAGIFKPNTPVVSAPQAPEAAQVLSITAKRNSAPIIFVKPGDYQTVDAQIARLSVKTAIPDIGDEAIESGVSRASLPARYEIIRDVSGYQLPYILVDGAHTTNSVKVVTSRMQKEGIFGNLLFGCADGKHVEEMAEIILQSGVYNGIYLTKPGDFKKSDLNRVSAAFSSSDNIRMVSPDFKNTIQKALLDSSQENLPLIVLGSFYLAGEVGKIIHHPKIKE